MCRDKSQKHYLWRPSPCDFCLRLLDQAKTASQPGARRQALSTLRIWVRGFAKNNHRRNTTAPYLPSMDLKNLLFPTARDASVMPPPSADDLQAAAATLSLDDSVSVVGPDLGGSEGEVPMDQELILLASPSRPLLPEPLQPVAILSATPPSMPEPSMPVPLQPSPAEPALPLFQPVPPLPPLSLPPVTSVTSVDSRDPLQGVDVAGIIQRSVEASVKLALSSNSSQMATVLARMKTIEEDLRSHRTPRPPTPPPRPLSAADCPPCSASNPWRYCQFMALADGTIHIGEGLGSRALSECEFYPDSNCYPNCFVRLRDESSLPPPAPPREVLLLDAAKARTLVEKVALDAGCPPPPASASSDDVVTFVPPTSVPFRFASKALHAVLDTSRDPKPPTLEECHLPFMVLPSASEDWAEVERTFIKGRLAPDVAQIQLRAGVPRLPGYLLTREGDVRERLASALSHQSLLEVLVHTREEDEVFQLLAKSHLPSLHRSLWDFVKARRACREFVLRHAKVREEPQKLIDSSIWGSHLFPDTLVREILDSVAESNIPLLDRWDSRHHDKRQHSPGQGPHSSDKRSRQGPSDARDGHRSSLPSTSSAPHSAAFNPRYEEAAKRTPNGGGRRHRKRPRRDRGDRNDTRGGPKH